MSAPGRTRTREQICETADLLLAEGGLEAVSMRAIGRRLGVTPMMIYNYFPNLEGLLLELRGRALAELAGTFVTAGEAAKGSRGRLLAMGEAYLAFAMDHPERYRLSHDARIGDLGQRGIQGMTPSWDLLVQAVRDRLAETGGRADPLTLAHMIWAALHGLASLQLAGRLSFGRDAHGLLGSLLSAFIDDVAGPLHEADKPLPSLRPALAVGSAAA